MEQNEALLKKLEEFSSEIHKYLKENDNEIDNPNLSKLKQLNEEFISEASKTKKEKEEEANKAQAELKDVIKKTEESADNINENNLESFKNTNNPSLNNYRIWKLLYLLFNPESNIPGDNIKKEIANMKNKCLNRGAKDIKHYLKNILQDISWITPQFLNKVRMYREGPYTNPKYMESISSGAKDITVYFQNLMKYKELYDIANGDEDIAKTKFEEIKKIIETEIEKNKKLLNEIKKEEKDNLLAKLDSCEKILGLLNIIGDCLQKN